MPDCAFCHGPAREPPALGQLLPTKKVVLDLVLPRGLDVAEEAAWTDGLRQRLDEEGVAVVLPDTPAASVVRIVIERDAGEGRTDGDAAYHAARYSARVRLLRARVRLRGTPGVSADADAAARAARDDLLDRLAAALTL